MNNWIFFFAFLIIYGCSSIYEGHWVLKQITYNGSDFTEFVGFRNTLISENKSVLPVIYIEELGGKLVGDAKVKFHTKGRNQYITVSNHPFFSGNYEILRKDDRGCEIVLTNDIIVITLRYNTDLDGGVTKDCSRRLEDFYFLE